MVIVMAPGATDTDVAGVVTHIETHGGPAFVSRGRAPAATAPDVAGVATHIEPHGGQAFVSRGVMRTIIGVVGTEDVLETLDAGQLPGVAETMRITAPYKLVSAQNHAKRTTVRVAGVPIGPDTF